MNLKNELLKEIKQIFNDTETYKVAEKIIALNNASDIKKIICDFIKDIVTDSDGEENGDTN